MTYTDIESVGWSVSMGIGDNHRATAADNVKDISKQLVKTVKTERCKINP